MSKGEKILAQMRANPKNDWTIKDLQTASNTIDGLSVAPPKRGSHYTLTHPSMPDYIMTLPIHNPINAVYVKKFLSMIDSITLSESSDDGR